jgi:hypothetical protein
LFGGFPFAAGTGRVVSLPEGGGEIQVDVSDLDAPVDVAPFGVNLLILEHGTYDQASGFRPGSGRLSTFDNMHGQRSVILDGLTRPVGLLVWGEDLIVVADLTGNLHFLKRDRAD